MENTDGTGSTVRVILFDYTKALDLIDHRIFLSKLMALALPYSILCCIADFLKNRRSQRSVDHKQSKMELPHIRDTTKGINKTLPPRTTGEQVLQ